MPTQDQIHQLPFPFGGGVQGRAEAGQREMNHSSRHFQLTKASEERQNMNIILLEVFCYFD